jgi:hypothetical protein
MNNPEIESLLKKARLPEISEESLAMFPRRIVAGIQHNDPPGRAARNFSPRLAWAFGLVACIVIAFAVGHWRAWNLSVKRWRCFRTVSAPLWKTSMV